MRNFKPHIHGIINLSVQEEPLDLESLLMNGNNSFNTRFAASDYISVAAQKFFNIKSMENLNPANAIKELHRRLQDNQYEYGVVLKTIKNVAEKTLKDQKQFNINFNTLSRFISVPQQSFQSVKDAASDSWSEVSALLNEFVETIVRGSMSEEVENQDRMEYILDQFINYDPSTRKFEDWVRDWFFGGRQSLFFNTTVKSAKLAKKKVGENAEGKPIYKYVPSEVSFSQFDRPGDEKHIPVYERGGQQITPESSRGFGLNEALEFVKFWKSKSVEERKNALVMALTSKDSTDLPLAARMAIKSNPNLFNDEIFSYFNDPLERVYDLFARRQTIKGNQEENVLKRKRIDQQIEEELDKANVYNELIVNFQHFYRTEQEKTEPAKEERQLTPEGEVIRDLRRKFKRIRKPIQENIIENAPIYGSLTDALDPLVGVYMDKLPPSFRQTLQGPELKELLFTDNGLNTLLGKKNYHNALINYLVMMGLFHAAQVWSEGAGKRSEKDTFDYWVKQGIFAEAKNLLRQTNEARNPIKAEQKRLGITNYLTPDKITKVVNDAYSRWINEQSANDRRMIRDFVNIVYRDFVTISEINKSKYQWGLLTPEQIQEIAQKVMDLVYPVSGEDIKRRMPMFSVMGKNVGKTKKVELDDEKMLALLVKEITNKNNAIKSQLESSGHSGKGIDVNIGDIIRKMNLPLHKLTVTEQDIDDNPTQAGVFRGMVKTSDINLAPIDDEVKNIFLKWLVNNNSI